MTTGADGPLLLCYDGSEDARHAIERAGALLGGRQALVLTAWQPTHGLGSFALAGATASMVDFFKLDRAAAEDAGNIAQDGVCIAQDVGLKAEPVTVEATGPVWRTIVEIAGNTMQRRSSWVPGASRAYSRCCWAASPAPSCITPTGPRWSSIAPATTLTSTDGSTPEEWSRRRSPSQWWHPPPAQHHPAVPLAFVADPGLVKRRLDSGVDPELLDAVGRHADDEHLGHGSQD